MPNFQNKLLTFSQFIVLSDFYQEILIRDSVLLNLNINEANKILDNEKQEPMSPRTDHTADYKALSVLTIALIVGILVFSGVSLLIHFFQGAFIQDKDLQSTAFGVVMIVAIIVIAGARSIYIRRVNKLMGTNQSSKEKLDIFRAITITHMAICEMTAILSIILFICFGNFLLFAPVLIALLEMIEKFPTQQRIESVVNSGTF